MNAISITHWGIFTWPDRPGLINCFLDNEGALHAFEMGELMQYETRTNYFIKAPSDRTLFFDPRGRFRPTASPSLRPAPSLP